MEMISFVIPARIDSMERLRNLQTVIAELSVFNSPIHILEADSEQKIHIKPHDNIKVTFIEDPNPIFYRTKYLNKLLRQVQTPFVGVWDADVIVPHQQIKHSINALCKEGFIFSSPFDGSYLMMNKTLSETYCKTRNSQLLNSKNGLEKLWEKPVWGGAFLVNRITYLQCGGENEHFYGWGPEDSERIHRLEILGHTIHRSKGTLYHLWHPRGKNSQYATLEQANHTRLELIKVCNMEKEELETYIASWNFT